LKGEVKSIKAKVIKSVKSQVTNSEASGPNEYVKVKAKTQIGAKNSVGKNTNAENDIVTGEIKEDFDSVIEVKPKTDLEKKMEKSKAIKEKRRAKALKKITDQ
jgi:hypothetical protein